MKGKLTHIDMDGNASMVDVSTKGITKRSATATGKVRMKQETMTLIQEARVKKGDVLSVAKLAGIMGAKKTSDLIPLCHPLAISSIDLNFILRPEENALEIIATCQVYARTGVEMEALTAVSLSALAIYDMCKAVDRTMHLTDIRLLAKSGGQSGAFKNND